MTSVHNHPLKYYPSVPVNWYCDMLELGKPCARNQTKQFGYFDYNTYVCHACKFYLCDLDLKKYEIKQKKSEKIEKNLKEIPKNDFFPNKNENLQKFSASK